MQVRRAFFLAVLLLGVVVSESTAARHHDPNGGKGRGKGRNGGSRRDYLVQGQSKYDANRPKDPTPLAPTSAGPYALAHRGSSGELPEETAESYQQAIALGADFIECDTVLTKDGHLICRHEPNLSNTTNADDLFPSRIKTYTIDFAPSTGVHSVDLTLAEVRTLRARQRLYPRDQSYNDVFKVITLEEYLDLAINAKRVVGTYVETKHPLWHDSFKLPALKGKTMTEKYIQVINSRGYSGKLNSKEWLRQPIFLQSFETANLRQLRTLTDLPIVQLLSGINSPIPDQGNGTLTPNGGVTPGRKYAELIVDAGLREVSRYADAIGPDKNIIAPRDRSGNIQYTTNLIDRAHKLGLQVHPYTFRNEAVYFAGNLNPPTIMSEFQLHIEELGADGAFADFIETLVAYLKFRRETSSFPRRQIFPKVDTSVNAAASL